MSDMVFTRFKNSLEGTNKYTHLRQGLIGEDLVIPGLFKDNPFVYADYVASGRGLKQVEDFIQSHVLPFYANSHTHASYCGAYMSKLRTQARHIIARECGASMEEYSTIFTGSGATQGINRLIHLFGIKERARNKEKPLILVGPYEHHSNILPWRESDAEVIEINEAEMGGPDLAHLEAILHQNSERYIIGAFNAASNVTGIMTDIVAVSELLQRYNARAVFDYACAGPYVPIDVAPHPKTQIDAIIISPHKFIGGPAASGVLIIRNKTIEASKPTFSGGGTVSFVSPWSHIYSDSIVEKEEAGTPNIIGDIRTALAFIVKKAIGEDYMAKQHNKFLQIATQKWSQNSNITLLGNAKAKDKLPIFSMQIKNSETGGFIHHQLFTKMLSDIYGIQARGGCACAGPYAHRLMAIDKAQSQTILNAIKRGQEIEKPGWTRLNFSSLLTDEKTHYIIDSVDELANKAHKYIDYYKIDETTARFERKAA